MADTSGWIKLHRTMLANPIFRHAGTFQLWAYCLMRANWEPKEWTIPGTATKIVVPRGSFITGQEALFAALYPERDEQGMKIRYENSPVQRTLWRWLENLIEHECLMSKVMSNRCTMITVVNYETYQKANEADVQPDVQVVVQVDDSTVSSTMSTNKETIQESKEGKESTHTRGEIIGIRPIYENQTNGLTFLSGDAESLTRFKAAYPKKTKPGRLREQWPETIFQLVSERGMTDQQAEEFVIDRAEAYACSPAGQPPPPGAIDDYRPNAADWLKDECFDEPSSEWQKPNEKRSVKSNGSIKKTADTSNVDEYFARRKAAKNDA